MERDNGKSHNQYNQQLKSKKPTRGNKKPIKVKYISSPMMVKACNASEFRAIVQELTGQQSELGGTTTSHQEEQGGMMMTMSSSEEIPSSNDSNRDRAYDQGLVVSQPVEVNETSLWRELFSETETMFGFQYPCVLV